MVNQADEPLTKVTLNLYTADVEYLAEKFPKGWTTVVREIIRNGIRAAEEEGNG